MKAGVLYSGGKDSSLAAILLGTYYEVELNTFVFDPLRQIPSVEAAAGALGYPLKKRVFRQGMIEEMADLGLQSGIERCHQCYPAGRAGIARSGPTWSGTARFDGPGHDAPTRCGQSLINRTGCSCVRPAQYSEREVGPAGGPALVVNYREASTITNKLRQN